MVNCCKNCSLKLVGKYQLKFCSKKCASVFYNKNISGKQCPTCKTILYKRWNDHIKKCLDKNNEKPTNTVKNTKPLKNCLECELSFKSKRKTHKFCRNDCYISWRKKNPIHRTEKEKVNLRHHIMIRYKNGWMPKAGRCKKIKYFSPIAGNMTLDGTWELYVAKYLDLKNLNWKRNKKRFRYLNLDNKISYYTPDFYVKEFNGYLEVKGYETDLDRCKWAQFKENLVIWKEKDISAIKKIFKN